MSTFSRRGSWLLASALALVAGQACVDDEVRGQSAKLLVLESPSLPIAPGERVRIAFQATDEVGAGVPDERLEVLVSDLTRLGFRDDPGNRVVLLTGKHVEAGGVTLEGAVVVELDVPKTAKPGSVTVIGSLEGDRGASSKTRWVALEIGESMGGGGAGGTSGAGGAGGEPTGGAGGSSGGDGGTSGAGGAVEGGAGGRSDGGQGFGGAPPGGLGGFADGQGGA